MDPEQLESVIDLRFSPDVESYKDLIGDDLHTYLKLKAAAFNYVVTVDIVYQIVRQNLKIDMSDKDAHQKLKIFLCLTRLYFDVTDSLGSQRTTKKLLSIMFSPPSVRMHLEPVLIRIWTWHSTISARTSWDSSSTLSCCAKNFRSPTTDLFRRRKEPKTKVFEGRRYMDDNDDQKKQHKITSVDIKSNPKTLASVSP